MKPREYLPLLVTLVAWLLGAGCNDGGRFARALEVRDRAQAIGGPAALVDLGDFVLENDQIRIGLPRKGNSTGPGVFGGSLIDADVRRHTPAHRAGRGLDQFAELFPVGNLAIPAVCQSSRDKVEGFCARLPRGLQPDVRVLCDGSRPCRTCHGRQQCAALEAQIDLERPENGDYADPLDPTRPGPAAPSEAAAVIRVEGPAGNYLEALGLVALANVKMSFRFRNDFILEPGSRVVRIRTLLTEANPLDGSVLRPGGALVELPSLKKPAPLFGILLGSGMFPTELPDLDPGVAGGDFLFFGERLHIFAPGVGFDVYRGMREKFATGQDPINNPLAAEYLAGVGEHVSYAIGSSDREGRYLLPIYSGAVTAGFTHGAHCGRGACQGTPEQCRNVIDCANARAYVFERLFAVGDGDVASAAGPLLRARGEPLGRLAGRVVDGRDGRPVSGAEVHAYPVPRSQADCLPGGRADQPWSGGPAGFEAGCLVPRHFQGAVSHLRTDRRADDLPAGRFEGELPPGRYFLLAKSRHRPRSPLVEVEVRADRETEAVLALGPPARIAFEVLDDQNQRVPAKLLLGQCLPDCAGRLEGACAEDAGCASGKCVETLAGRRCLVDSCPASRACNLDTHRCERREACRADGDCGLTERCLVPSGATEGRCACAPSVHRQVALAESSFPPGIGRYLYAPTGKGELEIEPGAYEVWASRGLEYSVDRQSVQALPAREALLTFRLRREVDTEGWVSGDFHVHGQNSYDAVVSHRDRVACFAGEGVEVLSTSDHDYITDLGPYVREMGLEKWLTSQVGDELTTVEIGHWLAFPLRYEEWRDGNRVREQGAVDWTGKPPEQLHRELRALGEFGPEDTVIVVAHPRDAFFGYFDQFGMNAFDPSRIEGSLFEYFPPFQVNPLATPDQFTGTFDALELFNSKRFELIRTPTAGEVRDYNLARQAVQALADQGAPVEVVEAELIALDRAYVKEMLRRTPAEQDAIWDADGRGGCELYAFCADDADCDSGAGQRCDRANMRCGRPCAGPSECGGLACREGFCEHAFAPAEAPCTKHEGVIDDWMRLIDHGVVRTGMGNSDTHQLFTQTEGGLPRNWIRSAAETPLAIDRRALARAIKAGRLTTSYGPFLEVWLGEAEVGELHTPAAGATTAPLRVRVQSPGWFDVDRVEIYRSGRLVHVLTGAGDELDPSSRVDVSGLAVPNPRVVNLDATFDEPVTGQDAWYVVVAMGLEGRDLSPVYTEHPYLKLEIGDILSRSLASVPLPMEIDSAAVPRVFRVLPYGVTNPVFLDADRSGRYDAPNPTPAWADGPAARRAQPLTSSRVGRSPLAPETSMSEMRAQQLRRFMAILARAFEHH